ncbi:MAG: sulfotransferase [Proteobacteria bacterium]|nr:sulfotransferase [Pseudomonadota bacterium]
MNRKLLRSAKKKNIIKKAQKAQLEKKASIIEQLLQQGRNHHRHNRFSEAENIYRQILAQRPDHADALYLLGLLSSQIGRRNTAINLISKAIHLAPENPDYYVTLGQIYEDMAQLETALTYYSKSNQLRPDNPFILNNLAAMCRDTGRYDQADNYFRDALRLAPNEPVIHINLTALYRLQGKIPEALRACEKAIRLQPDNIYGLSQLAALCLVQGRLKEAAENSEKIISLAGRNIDCKVMAYKMLVESKQQPPAELIPRLEKVTNQETMSTQTQRTLHFTLGSLFDKTGDYCKAFHHFSQANDYRKKVLHHYCDPIQEMISFLIPVLSGLDADFFRARKHYGVTTERPIFIVGMPRSGTTLVEQILASHPDVYGGGELLDIPKFGQELMFGPSPHSGFGRMQNFSEESAASFAEQYLNSIKQRAPGHHVATDKMVFNFALLWIIALLFPNAKIIHCKRNAMDTCLSCYFTDFRTGYLFKHDFLTLAAMYRQYQQFMHHWQNVLPLPILNIQYEDLVQDQERVSWQLLEFCDLSWHDDCLRFDKTCRSVLTASVTQVRDKIYTSSMNRWKHYEEYISPLIESFGNLQP